MYDLAMRPQLFVAPIMQLNNCEGYPTFTHSGASEFNCKDEDHLLSDISATTFQWDKEDHQVAPVSMASDSSMKTGVPSSQLTQTSLVSMMKASKATKAPVKRKRRPNPPKKMTELPEDFVPSNYSVLCGKGSENYNAVGNRRFRVTVGMFLERYANAKDRQEKSDCVRMVMEIIREACPVGAFVTLKDGRWYNVDERTAREKVGAFFRDSLHEQYRSSAKSKIARRKHKRRTSSDGSVSTTKSSTTSSTTSSESVTSWTSDESDASLVI